MIPDRLFKGMTRPALLFGIPYDIAMPGFGLSMAAYVKLGSVELLVILVGLTWLVGRHVGTKDQHFLRIAEINSKLLPSMRNTIKRIGCRSYSQR